MVDGLFYVSLWISDFDFSTGPSLVVQAATWYSILKFH